MLQGFSKKINTLYSSALSTFFTTLLPIIILFIHSVASPFNSPIFKTTFI